MTNIATFDTETFGTLADPYIVSMGLVIFHRFTGEIIDTFYTEIKAHGIRYAVSGWPEHSAFHDVKGSIAQRDGMHIDAALARVSELMADHDVRAIVAHNATFDRRALSRVSDRNSTHEMLAMEWICTLALSRKVAPNAGRHRLADVYERVAPRDAPVPHWHNALDDARAAKDVYCGLVNLMRPMVLMITVGANDRVVLSLTVTDGSLSSRTRAIAEITEIPPRRRCGAPTKKNGNACKLFTGLQHTKCYLHRVNIQV